MARRKLEDKNTRKLLRLGNSVSITLPIELIRQLKWRRGQKVAVRQRGKDLIISDWKK